MCMIDNCNDLTGIQRVKQRTTTTATYLTTERLMSRYTKEITKQEVVLRKLTYEGSHQTVVHIYSHINTNDCQKYFVKSLSVIKVKHASQQE